MPVYVYKRLDGSTFEIEQKITEPALSEDPESGEPVERVLFAPTVVFKGSGFHNTDYPRKEEDPKG